MADTKVSSKGSQRRTSNAIRTGPTVDDVELARLTLQLQAELTAWAKRKFWAISLLGGLAGFFGLLAVFQTTLSTAIEKTINNPVNTQLDAMRTQAAKFDSELSSQLDRFNDARDKASEALIQLNASRTRTEEVTSQARAVITDAQQRLASTISEYEALRERVAKLKSDVDYQSVNLRNLLDDAKRIKDNSEGLYASTYEVREDRFIDEIMYRNRISYIENIIEIITGEMDRVSGQSGAQSLRDKAEALRKATDDIERRLAENSKIKVVFYIRKGGGFADTAKVASSTLKRDGYRTDVWITNADSVLETIDEIGQDFPGSVESMRKLRTGIVVDPSQRSHGGEISEYLRKNFSLFRDVTVVGESPLPTKRLRMRGGGEKDMYAEENVILVFLLTE